MIPQHFKLREQPFGVTPDPKYLYASASHREALASLVYGLQSGLGFVSLVAKPGMGKTTLLFEVLRRLRDTRTTVFLFQTISTPVDLLRAILIDLGVKEARESLVDLQTQLNKVLLHQCAARKPVVVVIDEAQNLNDSVLETVRMLSNFETASQKLMQIILAGQLQLAEKLMTPDLLQLRQRISIFAHLTPLSVTETAAYILHRLKFAGLEIEEPIFTSEAIALIARHSEGIPRNINNLCFNAMSLAFALKCSKINSEIVNEVIFDLNVKEHLLSSDRYRVETADSISLEGEVTRVEDGTVRPRVDSPAELATPLVPEFQTQDALIDEYPTVTAYLPELERASETVFTRESPCAYDHKASFANAQEVGKTAVEPTLHPDGPLKSWIIGPVTSPIDDRSRSQVATRWLQQEPLDQTSHLDGDSTHIASDLRSTEPGDESRSNDVVLIERPIFSAFESHSRWRSVLQSWDHIAITAIVVIVGLCAWVGFVDYPTFFRDRAFLASSNTAEPVPPMNYSQSTNQSESDPSATLQHKRSIRIKKVESLSTLCNSLYGECTPELLERLFVLNPSILYPNRLRPGQVISIPFDSHNAKIER